MRFLSDESATETERLSTSAEQVQAQQNASFETATIDIDESMNHWDRPNEMESENTKTKIDTKNEGTTKK